LPIDEGRRLHHEGRKADERLKTQLRKRSTDETKTLVKNHYRRFYRPRTENSAQIRGKVLISETLQRNQLVIPKAYCEYAEFTSDILDNRIIKYTLYLLLGASSEIGQSYPQLRTLYPYFDDVELVSVTPDDFRRLHYDRLNQPYERVHRLCRLFIEHSYVAHLPGNYNLFCYGFDMNALFEEFVREALRASLASYGLAVGGPGAGFLDVEHAIKIKPDVEIFQGSERVMLLDCKYKKTPVIEDDTSNAAVPLNSDVYQMLAYLVANRLKKGVLAYPRHES
jgi:5-methylcytosine-specific restriction enzyme subunit McrC